VGLITGWGVGHGSDHTGILWEKFLSAFHQAVRIFFRQALTQYEKYHLQFFEFLNSFSNALSIFQNLTVLSRDHVKNDSPPGQVK
jgi:hypothetical protein